MANNLTTIVVTIEMFLFCTFTVSAVELRIYGGENHNVYLGLLNGSKCGSDSIWNKYGDHGSKYNDKSIWNKYGDYGGAYSRFSPFNQYASDPPVIVDITGNFYGYLTCNKYKDKRANFRLANQVCLLWEKAYDDLDAVYDSVSENLNPVFTGQASDNYRTNELNLAPSKTVIEAPKPPSRIWKDHKGSTVSAKWIAVSDDETTFSLVSDKTGNTIMAKIYKLSREDQSYLRSAVRAYKKDGYYLHNGWWVKRQQNKTTENIRNQSSSRHADAAVVLEGCSIVADDGTFLGKITWNDVASDSIFNIVGRYGSDVSSTSIWNDVSPYGSDVSSKSAFNDVAVSPPKIVKGGKFVGYLTVNDTKPGAVSPKCLLSVIGEGADEMYLKKLGGLRR